MPAAVTVKELTPGDTVLGEPTARVRSLSDSSNETDNQFQCNCLEKKESLQKILGPRGWGISPSGSGHSQESVCQDLDRGWQAGDRQLWCEPHL